MNSAWTAWTVKMTSNIYSTCLNFVYNAFQVTQDFSKGLPSMFQRKANDTKTSLNIQQNN